MPRWGIEDAPDQTGRTVVVTGANSGLGLRSAEALASRGATVVLACRSLDKGATALEAVKARAAADAPTLVHLDLADLDSVRECAARLVDELAAVDVLMDNAGVMAVPMGRTPQGFEMQFGTNHLGHFALTGLLLPALLRSAAPRVVAVSSNAHRMRRLRFDDLNWEREAYRPWRAYAQSKVANLLFAKELAGQAAANGSNLLAVAAHPGWAATNLTAAGPGSRSTFNRVLTGAGNRLFAQSDAQGALPQLYAATMSDVQPDDYYGPDRFREQRGHPTKVVRTAQASDPALARRLWEQSEALTGVTYDWHRVR